MTNANDTAAIEWNSRILPDRAARILGYANLAALLADPCLAGMDSHRAAGHASGAWYANEREAHAAWRSIAVTLAAEGR